MIIEKITLHNFKTFENTCSIDSLSKGLTSQKRIVLFGGLNGSGKTSLFEAILLCLYGNRNKALWPSQGAKRESYENYILSIVNVNARTSFVRTEMYVELVLRDIELGGIHQDLVVRRTWNIDAGANRLMSEDLIIAYNHNGTPLESYSKEGWQDFIEELIPYEVSQYFFFDGEKIQNFVRDEDREFAQSLEKVLGISLYKQLQDDLETTRQRIVTEHNKNESVNIEIARIDQEIADHGKTIFDLETTIDNSIEEQRRIEARIEDLNLQTQRITRLHEETLEGYQREKEQLLSEKGVLESRIWEAIADDIPFVIAAELCQSLSAQLQQELELDSYHMAQAAVSSKIDLIIQKLFDGLESIPPLLPPQQSFYEEKLQDVLKETLAEKPLHLQQAKHIHGLSRGDAQQIINRINESISSILTLSSDVNRLQEIDPKLSSLQQAERHTVDPEVKRLYEERGELKERLWAIGEEIVEHGAEIEKRKADIASKRSMRTELEHKAALTEKMRKEIEYCRKLKETLEDFSREFRIQRVEKLEAYTQKMWKKLARKQDQVKAIKIEPERQFSIVLYDGKDRLIDKTKLSAGEKELLAISLIWALSQIAGYSIPIVIDTPLGRLDTVHREHIAKNYFANAGQQVLLLSTDTEIVGKELEVIEPYISRKFLISKPTAAESSRIISGQYFQ